jgi:sugar phosphate permease
LNTLPDSQHTQSSMSRFLYMMAIILAGEMIFSLPFVIQRVFRPTLLKVFAIDNFELGLAFSVYGLIAIIAYFVGGPIADRFSARRLMSSALIMTAMGGIYYATFPKGASLKALYGYWGVTTILLFWAAMIKATRVWGGSQSQGKAFGILDGGRGLCSALLATLTVSIFASLLPEQSSQASIEELSYALQYVMYITTGLTVIVAVVVWFCLPDELPNNSHEVSKIDETEVQNNHVHTANQTDTWKRLIIVLKNKAVWLQGLIVITAYCTYKSNDNIGLYAQDVFLFTDVDAAQLSTLSFWVRPFAALGAGFLGDKIGPSRGLIIGFSGLTLAYIPPAFNLIDPSQIWLLYVMIMSTSVFVFGLRGLYFSIFEEAKIAPEVTGTAVGVVSVIGYLPDLFMGPLIGYLNKVYPGITGHVYIYLFLFSACIVGLFASLIFRKVTQHQS